MAIKSTRYIDPQGRIVLPNHIRKALNLGTGNVVQVELEDDGTIRIRAEKSRCSVCGHSVEDKVHAKIKVTNGMKHICYKCAHDIAQAMIKQM